MVWARHELTEKLTQLKDFNGVTGTISFDLQGEVEKEPLLLTIFGKRFYILP